MVYGLINNFRQTIGENDVNSNRGYIYNYTIYDDYHYDYQNSQIITGNNSKSYSIRFDIDYYRIDCGLTETNTRAYEYLYRIHFCYIDWNETPKNEGGMCEIKVGTDGNVDYADFVFVQTDEQEVYKESLSLVAEKSFRLDFESGKYIPANVNVSQTDWNEYLAKGEENGTHKARILAHFNESRYYPLIELEDELGYDTINISAIGGQIKIGNTLFDESAILIVQDDQFVPEIQLVAPQDAAGVSCKSTEDIVDVWDEQNKKITSHLNRNYNFEPNVIWFSFSYPC